MTLFRATFLTALALDAPAHVVQKWGRHKDFETTQRYMKVADEAMRQGAQAIATRLETFGLSAVEPIVNTAVDAVTNSTPRRRPRRRRAA